MYVIFFALWIILNGRVTLEIVLFGLVIAAVMYAFIWKFMDFDPRKELQCLKKSAYLIQYLYYLIKEIVAANVTTIRLLLSANYALEPVVIQVSIPLKSDISRFLLANSITLTPGTITVSVENDLFTVHCLDNSLAEGIEDSVFVRLLKKMEESHV